MTSSLKPCPFCGSRDIGLIDPDDQFCCRDCGAASGCLSEQACDADKQVAWNTRVSPWRSLEDDPPNKTTGRLIALRGPIPETPEEASQYFGCSGYVYGYMKRYGHHWDNSNKVRLPLAVFTHWMEVPE